MPESMDVISPSASKKRTRATVLVLALLAISLYAPMIGWGVPDATASDRTKTFATDEILPLEGLAEMHNTFVVSKPDRNYGYPWFHYFVVAAAQSPYVAYLAFSGQMQSGAPEFPFGLQDPVRALQVLTLIGRSLSVLMGAGIVIAAYFFSRILWGHLTGVVAAVLTMLNYLMFYYSRTGNLDVPMFFWSSLGLVVFAKIMKEGLTTRRALLLGVFAALATATKDQGVLNFLPVLAVLSLAVLKPSQRSRPNLKAAMVGLVGFVAVYLVATGMVVDPQRHLTHVYRLFFDTGHLSSGAFYQPLRPKTFGGILQLVGEYVQGLGATMSWPVLLAAAAGALLLTRSSPKYLVFLIPLLAIFLFLTIPTRLVVLRYFLPGVLFVDAFAAYALVSLRGSSLRHLWLPLLIVLCGWRLLIGADLTYAQMHDTRYAASQWLAAHLRAGDRLEYFGITEKLPHLSAQISTRRIAGRTVWKRESGHGPRILQYLSNGGPEYVVEIPDATSPRGTERSGDCPQDVYEALVGGTVGYSQVAFFPTRHLLSGMFKRPALDNPSVCPPVRIFARREDVNRGADVRER